MRSTTKVSRLPVLFSALSFALIALGAIGVVWLQNPLARQSQDLRRAASIDTGLVQVAANPSSGSTLSVSPNPVITLTANTQNTQVDGIQLVFKVKTDSTSLNFFVLPQSSLQAVFQEVEKVSDGFLVSVIALPQTFGQSYKTTTASDFAKITLDPKTTGTVTITFDSSNSISTVTNTDPPDDQLKTMPTLSYSIAAAASPTPSPTPSPAIRTCNQSCDKNADCDVNLRCVTGYCRRADNPNSTSCAAPSGDQGIRRGCNEYCADSTECGSGFTCFYNRCRAPGNPDSAACAGATATTTQATEKSCNQPCANNKECAVNLRCYNGACRFATNPGSLSCSPYTSATVTSMYGYTDTTSSKGEEVPAPSVSPKPEDKDVTFPSPSPITSASTSGTGDLVDQQTTENQSALQALASTIVSRVSVGGWSLPQIAIAVGVLLLLLALIIFILSTLNASRSSIGAAKVTKTPSEYEQKLQSRISELRGQQAKPAQAADLPVNFRATPSMPLTSTVANAAAKPITPVPPAARPAAAPIPPAKPIAPAPVVTPPVPAAPTTPVASTPAAPVSPAANQSTAMQKLKDKGLM